nr:TetR/AcrR family transcriptional regulator [uncultured Caproiciproducens sp.]
MRVSKKPEERKLEIAEAALKLFLEKGYENVSVKDITNKVNVAAGLFHYYFHSKEDVFMECIRFDRQKFIDEFNESDYFPANMGAVDKINLLLSETLHNIMARTQLVKDGWNINSAMLLEQVKDGVLGGISDKLAEFIIQGNEEGVFDCKYPQATAEIAVYGLNHHFMREQQRDPSLKQYLLGEYVFIAREKIRDIFMSMLNMKEPMGLFDFQAADAKTETQNKPK